jgi:hypothetical protein
VGVGVGEGLSIRICGCRGVGLRIELKLIVGFSLDLIDSEQLLLRGVNRYFCA